MLLRTLLTNALKRKLCGATDVAILYSGGFESFTCLMSCLELGIKPTLYTFYLESVESYDIRKARNDAKIFGVRLVEIKIPNDYKELKSKVFEIIKKFKTTRKTIVQCLHPLMYALPIIKEKYVIIGLERGLPWGLNRRGAIAGKAGKETFDEYRRNVIPDDETNSTKFISDFINEKHVCIRPYDDDDVDAWFMTKTWEELNKPKEKNVILVEYAEEIRRSGMQPRKFNYQVGSKIRELHDLLLADNELNPSGKYVNVVGVYNNINKIIENGIQLQLEF